MWFFNYVRYTKSLLRGNFQAVPQKCVRLVECPLYRDFLIRDFLTVRLVEMSALWCVRLIEIPLYMGLNLNRKSEINSHFAFVSITWVFEKVMFHFELRNTLKISCLLWSITCWNLHLHKVVNLSVGSLYLKWFKVHFLVQIFYGSSPYSTCHC